MSAKRRPRGIRLFLTVFTVGIGTGLFLCNRLLHGEIDGWIVPWGTLGIGFFSIDLWLGRRVYTDAATAATLNSAGEFLSVPGSWRILGDLLGISVSGGVFALPLYTLLQTVGDPLWRARMVGANNVINAAAMVLSAVAVMALIAVGVSVPGLFLLTGIATLGVTVRLWQIRKNSTRSADGLCRLRPWRRWRIRRPG